MNVLTNDVVRQESAKELGVLGEIRDAISRATAINILAKPYLVTLTASGWTGDGPYTQTVAVPGGVTGTTTGLIGPAQSATAQQRSAAREAVLGISGQGADTVTVIADGVKPTVDIPAEIVIFASESDYYTKSVTDALLAGKADASAVTATQNMIATVEQTSTASKAYAVGEYLVYQGTLYRVTSAIASGGQITPGESGNVEAETVGERLTQDAQAFAVHTRKMHILDQIASGTYWGESLTERFASEISGYSDEWAWVKARIAGGDFEEIYIADYIPITTTNGVSLQAQVAGINTYKGYGGTAVGNHIDFICRELWPTLKPVNPVNYNNGLIPVETITGDGTTTEFTLTKEMTAISSVTQGGTGLTNYSYDASTFKLTFTEAPAAGAITVTGTGTEHPWLASDLYLFLNSLAGQIPNSTGLNPAVKHVDYTQGGVYHYLPTALKNVIVEKRAYLPKRYSASGMLSDDNAGGWADIGKLWLPSESEVYGAPCWGGKGGYSTTGNNVQYPLFAHNMNRLKYHNGSRATWWVLSVYSGNTTTWCIVGYNGSANYNYASHTTSAAPVCFRIS